MTACKFGLAGLPSCLAGTRGERWWCEPCREKREAMKQARP